MRISDGSSDVCSSDLSNAVKFTAAGGRAWVTVAARDGKLEIAVHDTGVGMAAQDIPKALAPFGQVRGVLSRDHQGTGLGRSEEHTSELQSLMRISYAVFCLKKKKKHQNKKPMHHK